MHERLTNGDELRLLRLDLRASLLAVYENVDLAAVA